MKFGYCTGFSTSPHFLLGQELLPMIKDCGFDYVEFPLMNFYDMSDEAFEKLKDQVFSLGLNGPAACNFFPGNVRLVGSEVDAKKIKSYLDVVLPRCKALGINKIILGSGPARTFSSEQTAEQAFNQFAGLLKDVILPKVKEYSMFVCIEPFERNYCNLIVSVMEGLDLVKKVNDPSLMLMVDLYHMLSNGESLSCLKDCFAYIKHVHIAGPNRRLTCPGDKYIYDALDILYSLGYKDSVSFETEMASEDKIKAELISIKTHFRS